MYYALRIFVPFKKDFSLHTMTASANVNAENVASLLLAYTRENLPIARHVSQPWSRQRNEPEKNIVWRIASSERHDSRNNASAQKTNIYS